jgi:hypothetical protein
LIRIRLSIAILIAMIYFQAGCDRFSLDRSGIFFGCSHGSNRMDFAWAEHQTNLYPPANETRDEVRQMMKVTPTDLVMTQGSDAVLLTTLHEKR